MTGHALMLLSNHYSHDARVRREARDLVKAGWRVTVLCWDRAAESPAEEQLDGARIVRLRSTRMMALRGFDLLRLAPWNRLAARAAIDLHTTDPFTLIHAHDLDTLPAALRVKRRLGLPVLYDAHEIWGYMIAKDLPSPVVSHYLRLEQRLLPFVDHTVTVSEAVADHLHPHTTAPVDLVLNAKEPIGESYTPPPRHQGLEVVYIGVLNRTRRIHTLIEAVAAEPGWSLYIAGYGPDDYEARIRDAALEYDNVTFAGRIPQNEVLGRTLDADVVACPFDPTDPLTQIGMPNKVFEAMATGRPTLTTMGTHLGRFVEMHKIGIAAQDDEAGIRSALGVLTDSAVREQMGRKAYAMGEGVYGWESQFGRLLAAYGRLAKLDAEPT